MLAELTATGGDLVASDSQSVRVSSFLRRVGVGSATQVLPVLIPLEGGVGDGRRRVRRAQVELSRVPGIVSTKSSWSVTRAGGGQLLGTEVALVDRRLSSRDGAWALVVAMLGGRNSDQNRQITAGVRAQLDGTAGTIVTGEVPRIEETTDAIGRDIRRGDLIALPLLFLVLFWAFKRVSLVAIPLAIALITLLVTLTILRGMHMAGLHLSLLAAAPVAGIALGLSVDYSLLFVGRYTEELQEAPTMLMAVDRAVRAVAPTILTCVAAITLAVGPLILVPIPAVSSLGVACTCCALVAGAAAVLLAPLGLLVSRPGAEVDRRRRFGAKRNVRFWVVVPRWAIGHRWMAMIFGFGLLGLLVVPALGLRIGSVSPADVLPGTEAARAERIIETRFLSSVTNERLSVMVQGRPREAKRVIARIEADAGGGTGIESVTRPLRLSGDLWAFEVQSGFERESSEATSLVRQLRALSGDAAVAVSSISAKIADRESALKSRIPIVLVLGLIGVTVVLFAMTASIAIPIKLFLLTGATVAAALGVVAIVFQGIGHGGSGPVSDSTQIVSLSVLAAALVIDYGVFVAARIVEEHNRGSADDEAIGRGLVATGPIVSVAAVVFTVALGSFVFSEVTLVRQLCVGLIAAVLIDAVLVRAILVPALMKSLGPYNWRLPRWARRLHAALFQG